jgi:hypothetical protein
LFPNFLIFAEVLRKKFDVLCTGLYVSVYLVLLPAATTAGVLGLNLGAASSAVVMVEMVNFQ